MYKLCGGKASLLVLPDVLLVLELALGSKWPNFDLSNSSPPKGVSSGLDLTSKIPFAVGEVGDIKEVSFKNQIIA